MNIYLADLYQDGKVIALQYEAADHQEAQLIADENDWDLLGELVFTEECDDMTEAIIQSHTVATH